MANQSMPTDRHCRLYNYMKHLGRYSMAQVHASGHLCQQP